MEDRGLGPSPSSSGVRYFDLPRGCLTIPSSLENTPTGGGAWLNLAFSILQNAPHKNREKRFLAPAIVRVKSIACVSGCGRVCVWIVRGGVRQGCGQVPGTQCGSHACVFG